MDKLLETLKVMSTDQLDDVLDQRDRALFDSQWMNLYQQVNNVELSSSNPELFIQLSNATNHHEVCSYIIDDFELISKAETLGIKSDFLDYLKLSYERGFVPTEEGI